ncbi:MAG: hypothetical protein J6Y02_01310 [Pseudobutyrivibrio sp.]|nr:hypothetical protein [Pseudobutyrivibrio sp.]
MSIVTGYNNKVDKTYAYEMTYEWNDELKRHVQKKKCIGHIDPKTGDIVPNNKTPGRPAKENSKCYQYRLRCSEKEYKLIKQISNEQGLPISDFIRSCVNLYMKSISKEPVFED